MNAVWRGGLGAILSNNARHAEHLTLNSQPRSQVINTLTASMKTRPRLFAFKRPRPNPVPPFLPQCRANPSSHTTLSVFFNPPFTTLRLTMRIQFSLRRFLRSSRPDPVLPVPNPVDIRPLPSPNTGARLDYPDRLTVLSQWWQLGTLDPRSHNYVELLERLVDVERNRKLALEFTDGDAGAVINIIDEVSSCHRLCCCTPDPSVLDIRL